MDSPGTVRIPILLCSLVFGLDSVMDQETEAICVLQVISPLSSCPIVRSWAALAPCGGTSNFVSRRVSTRSRDSSNTDYACSDLYAGKPWIRQHVWEVS